MGHVAMKDVYTKLGDKIDNLHVRVPMNETFYEILNRQVNGITFQFFDSKSNIVSK